MNASDLLFHIKFPTKEPPNEFFETMRKLAEAYFSTTGSLKDNAWLRRRYLNPSQFKQLYLKHSQEVLPPGKYQPAVGLRCLSLPRLNCRSNTLQDCPLETGLWLENVLGGLRKESQWRDEGTGPSRPQGPRVTAPSCVYSLGLESALASFLQPSSSMAFIILCIIAHSISSLLWSASTSFVLILILLPSSLSSQFQMQT